MHGKPMMPTKRFGKVRRSFTIQLSTNRRRMPCRSSFSGQIRTEVNIGVAAVRSDGTCLMADHLETRHRKIPDLMASRRMHRRTSRYGEWLARERLAKKHGTTTDRRDPRVLPECEKPVPVKNIRNPEARFSNRKRPEWWLTPTARQLLQTHENLAACIGRYLPVSGVSERPDAWLAERARID